MPHRTSWTARCRRRGAALVESVVVIPAFVILFGGMLFLHHVIREQQRVMRDARDAVWTAAMRSCVGDGDGVARPDLNSTMTGAPGSDVSLQQNLGMASGSKSGAVAVSALGGGATGAGGGFAFRQAVSAHAAVYCDNQTKPGDVAGVFAWLVGAAKEVIGLL
jgi:hypothetical protein